MIDLADFKEHLGKYLMEEGDAFRKLSYKYGIGRHEAKNLAFPILYGASSTQLRQLIDGGAMDK